VHNRGVSYFEECLTSGGLRFQEERRALYKYLLEINNDFYVSQANLLLDKGTITRSIANGEATYFLKNRMVGYSELRDIKLTRLRFYNIRKLQRFFAQCDVDVISNFPLPGPNPQEGSGYGFNAKPFYTVAYYANGQNLFVGLMKKIRKTDREMLTKLRTL